MLVALLAAALAGGLAARAGNRNAYPLPEERGTAGTLAALEKLPVYVRALYTTAHPDDEGAGMVTWLARGAHARTALLSLTRGDGGQNVLGDEKYEAMGLLRTGELLEACRIYGTEIYFTSVFEFGFSKSAEETLSKWGHDETLGEVVRFIRTWRPTIIVSRFQGTDQDGHGHHQTAGILSKEAFRAAGSAERFPEQLREGLEPWQAKKLYEPGRGGDGSSGRSRRSGQEDWTVRIDTGAHDPVLGRSYREIGAEGYSKHRSQGSGARYAPPGRGYDYLKLADATVAKKPREETVFDGIDTSLASILDLAGAERGAAGFLEADLAGADRAAREALTAFTPRNPAASAPAAARGLALLVEAVRKVEASTLSAPVKAALQDALGQKRGDFEDAVSATLGVYAGAVAEDALVVPGDKLAVTVRLFNRGGESIDVKRVSLWTPEGWVASLPASAPLGPLAAGHDASFRHEVQVPAAARVTEPFWYREKPSDTRYKHRPTRNVFAPFDEPEVRAVAAYRYRDVEVMIRAAALAQVDDAIRGVDFRDVQVVPRLAVVLEPELGVAPVSAAGQKRPFQVTVASNANSPQRGEVRLVLPAGWQSEPRTAAFELARRGEVFSVQFALSVPPGTKPGTFPLEAVATSGGAEFRRGYSVVSYPENWTRHLYAPARAELRVFDVKVAPNLTVGYVPGAGDEVPAALESLGAKVQTLAASDLAHGDLGRFGAIVTGIRAYNVNEPLRANNKRLLEYVEQGGTLIVQYNRPLPRARARGGSGGEDESFPYALYPLTISNDDRITVEESPVEILEASHPAWTKPNAITSADFTGWVQERGLYFARDWDKRYTSLLSGHDPGEPAKAGGMLVARYGRGYYVYTAYAWFRQLPAGVPGAYRIFANLLSLGR
jgi:hypothetical protein